MTQLPNETQLTINETLQLIECETVIAQGLQTFYEVGNALLAIRAGRLYRQGYGTFEDYCQDKWGMTKTHANRLIASSGVAQNLTPMGVKAEDDETKEYSSYPLPVNERQTRPLASLPPEQQREAWQHAVETAPDGRITAAHVGQIVDEFREPLKPHVAHNSGNNEWYTPQEYIDAARVVMGHIDLDPASSVIANEQIQATRFYDAQTNGLKQDWQGKVWLNPPYASHLISEFIDKLKYHVLTEDVSEAIVLVNNATDTAWFETLVSVSDAIVFPSKRIKFWSPTGKIATPLQGQAILYIGTQKELFFETFAGFGWGAIIE